MIRAGALSVLAAALCLAQSQPLPPVQAAAQPASSTRLEFTGQPLRLEFTCNNEDIAAAGLQCPPEDPCPLFFELASVESVGNRLVAAGNFHTASATVASLLLVSEDGRVWTEPFERIRLGALDQIQFFDFEIGWVSGQLVVSNTPRDPFFLLTSDGGKIWRRRPLWEEGRTGLVDSFWFDSLRHGLLALDRVQAGPDESRYALYESQTGGESWSIRQVSPRPLRIVRHEGNTDLRVRADGPTRSYRIERRERDRWQTVSAFLIEIGACKQEEVRVVEPQAPEEAGPARAQPPTPRKK